MGEQIERISRTAAHELASVASLAVAAKFHEGVTSKVSPYGAISSRTPKTFLQLKAISMLHNRTVALAAAFLLHTRGVEPSPRTLGACRGGAYRALPRRLYERAAGTNADHRRGQYRRHPRASGQFNTW